MDLSFEEKKSNIKDIIPKFHAFVLTQFGKKIKTVRSNNVKELEFKDFFAEKGIEHQLSCDGRPQRNSVMERKHQHLLNVSRSLMY